MCPVCGRASLATSDYCADHRPEPARENHRVTPGEAEFRPHRYTCTPAGSEMRDGHGRTVYFPFQPYNKEEARRYWEALNEIGMAL